MGIRDWFAKKLNKSPPLSKEQELYIALSTLDQLAGPLHGVTVTGLNSLPGEEWRDSVIMLGNGSYKNPVFTLVCLTRASDSDAASANVLRAIDQVCPGDNPTVMKIYVRKEIRSISMLETGCKLLQRNDSAVYLCFGYEEGDLSAENQTNAMAHIFTTMSDEEAQEELRSLKVGE